MNEAPSLMPQVDCPRGYRITTHSVHVSACIESSLRLRLDEAALRICVYESEVLIFEQYVVRFLCPKQLDLILTRPHMLNLKSECCLLEDGELLTSIRINLVNERYGCGVFLLLGISRVEGDTLVTKVESRTISIITSHQLSSLFQSDGP